MPHIGSMYGIFTYIWLIFMVNVGKYTIHGSYGKGHFGRHQFSELLLLELLVSGGFTKMCEKEGIWKQLLRLLPIQGTKTIYFSPKNFTPANEFIHPIKK